ncbi:DUF5004 domain-containing protein [Galbibacter sp. PAP.153]|uniref:DUF5004 domain-containing protein n=1 Tax=Galbibacter sp. PAP.153 TaxID=3104623 RepID=UPI00300BAC68
MKNQKLIATTLFVALMGVFVSCTDDDSDNCVPDYTGALSEAETAFVGEWRLSAIEADEEVDLTDDDEDNPSTDIFAQQTACQNDQVYEYNSDRTFTYSAGQNEEDCEGAGSIAGTWKLGGDTLGLVYNCFEDILALDFDAQRTSYRINSNVRIEDVDGKVIQTQITLTYTKAGAEEPAPEEEN